MHFLLASLATLAPAWADSITLDSGATIEGDLARYDFGGDCQVSVTEGDLTGVIVIVPCHRVQSFVRTTVRAPAAIGLREEAVSAAENQEELQIAADSASAGVPLQTAVQITPQAELRASAPQGAAVQARPASDDPYYYDEPLFPGDPDEPIGVATASPAVSSAPSSAPSSAAAAPSPASSSGASSQSTTQRSAAPAPIEPTGPRMAPRMDEPTPPGDRRPVNF